MQELLKKPTKIVAGLMSGTSADGIDVAVCAISRASSDQCAVSIDAFGTYPYTQEVSDKIKRAHSLTVQELAELDIIVGKEFSRAFHELLNAKGMSPAVIDLIGSHGQTVYHHSGQVGAHKASLQIGCADAIALGTGRPVYFDFRRKDIVLGGEGAPLTPYTDFVMYYKKGTSRAVLNLGGIANITILGDSMNETRGFDTGPANAPLDRLAGLLSGGAQNFDRDGMFAKSGTVNPKLLQTLITQDAYLKASPPKSTGFEVYGDSFVRYCIGIHGGIDVHLIATMTEFVAMTISDSIKRYVPKKIDEIILAGGGARNPVLREAITRLCAPIRITLSDDVGISADAREAAAFAILAHDSFLGLHTSIAGVTGASQTTSLGKIALP